MMFKLFTAKTSSEAHFLICPFCSREGKGMTVKVYAQSVLRDVPVYCRKCKKHYIIDYADGIETVTATLTQNDGGIA